MLKMKIDPAMCMKRQARGQYVTPKTGLFAGKCTNCTMIYQNQSGFLAENASIAR